MGNAQDTHHERPKVCRDCKVTAAAVTAILPKVPTAIALSQSLLSTHIADFTLNPRNNIDNPTNRPQCLHDRGFGARGHPHTVKCALEFKHTARSARSAVPK